MPTSSPGDSRSSPPTASVTNTQMLRDATADDPQAWQTIVQIYGPLIYRWVRKAGVPEAASADLVQDVLLAVSQKLSTFRRDKPGDSFRGWLYGITRFKVMDHWRAASKTPHGAGGTDAYQALANMAEPTFDAGTQDDVGNLYARAAQVIAADFAPKTRQAFLAIVFDKKTPKEVAAELGMSVNAVYIAKARVLARLREMVDDAPMDATQIHDRPEHADADD